MKRLARFVAAAAATLALAACGDSSVTAPRQAKAPSNAHPAFDGITCRSGYVVAYDENGNPYCAPAGGGNTATRKP